MFDAFRAVSKNKSKAKLRLSVPDLDPVENPKVETDPARQAEWINSLPYADPHKAVENMLAELYLLNRFPGQIKQRKQLADLFLAPYYELSDEARLYSYAFDINATRQKKTRFSQLFQQFTTELAIAYKIILNEIASGKTALQGVELAQSCYLACKFINLQLIFCFSGFTPAPGILRREILQIYQFALGKKVAEIPINDERSGDVQIKPTVGSLIKQSLLEQLLDPYRLMPGEIWNAHQYLSHWAHITKFKPADVQVESKPGLFLIDMRGIESPAFLARVQDKKTKAHHRIFNIVPLIKLAHEHLHKLQQDDDSLPPGTAGMDYDEVSAMLRDMLVAWHMKPERRAARNENYGILQGANGILDSHFYQQQSSGKSPLAKEDNTTETDDSILISEQALGQAVAPAMHATFQYRQFNSSDSGIGLEADPPYPDSLQVGQVMLLQYEKLPLGEADKSWFLGVVRRLIHHDNSVEFGIQKISGRLTPVRISNSVVNDSEAQFRPAILVEKKDSSKNLLITPAGLYRDESQYRMEIDSNNVTINAVKLLERNYFFDRFYFRLAPEQN
ncbi:MAG: hypothetical protein PVG66_00050 [Chromatiales bacterium]|jgi:hypothetical protein